MGQPSDPLHILGSETGERKGSGAASRCRRRLSTGAIGRRGSLWPAVSPRPGAGPGTVGFSLSALLFLPVTYLVEYVRPPAA